jgi:hypothetical protein
MKFYNKLNIYIFSICLFTLSLILNPFFNNSSYNPNSGQRTFNLNSPLSQPFSRSLIGDYLIEDYLLSPRNSDYNENNQSNNNIKKDQHEDLLSSIRAFDKSNLKKNIDELHNRGKKAQEARSNLHRSLSDLITQKFKNVHNHHNEEIRESNDEDWKN